MGSILIRRSFPAGVRLVDCSGSRASRPVSQLSVAMWRWRRGTAKGTRIVGSQADRQQPADAMRVGEPAYLCGYCVEVLLVVVSQYLSTKAT